MKMSRFILLCAFILTVISSVAQPRLPRPEMYIGVHGGVLASSMIFDPSVKGLDIKQSPLTPNGGLVFRYAGHKVCGLQVELNYMQRGWRELLQAEDGTTVVDYRRMLDYIELPLLMHIYLGREHFRGFINLGPQIGYCFRDIAIYPSQYEMVISSAPHHQPIDKPFDWGLAGGLGCYYRTKKIGLFQLEARFNYSMGTIYNNRKVDYFSQSNAMNLSINFAYMWEIKID